MHVRNIEGCRRLPWNLTWNPLKGDFELTCSVFRYMCIHMHMYLHLCTGVATQFRLERPRWTRASTALISKGVCHLGSSFAAMRPPSSPRKAGELVRWSLLNRVGLPEAPGQPLYQYHLASLVPFGPQAPPHGRERHSQAPV